ncbi:hypothetical protein KPH14_012600 [Odynerus spinipes]|uniref:Uncharacterized protein n=1 Tax=Odynerus spinipes TaxID=1348599 RepID=A0AAD9RFV0_9HYME|nr:hypothetical protein KPH14_012600 [Odynerus spinipes]
MDITNVTEMTNQKSKRKRSTSPFGSTKRKRWTDIERCAILTRFSEDINKSHLPSSADITDLKYKNACLKDQSVNAYNKQMEEVLNNNLDESIVFDPTSCSYVSEDKYVCVN